ncbi:MAG: hypothetical protein JSS82_14200 [Bacteroidetes bacterium]|nr:hypothetical protein [Bacteroidota bacterium]
MAAPKYYPAPQLPADIAYQDIFDAITDVVTDKLLGTLHDNVNTLMNTLCTPDGTLIEPTRPVMVDDESTWDTYRADIASYYATLNSTRNSIQADMDAVTTGLQGILAMLPPNIWVKLSADNVGSGWPGSAPAVYYGYHSFDALVGYQPSLLKLQPSHDPEDNPLADGEDNPANVRVLTIDSVLGTISNYDADALARVLAGDYTGG